MRPERRSPGTERTSTSPSSAGARMTSPARQAERARAASRSAFIAISPSARRPTERGVGRTRASSRRGSRSRAAHLFSAQGQNWSLPAPNPLTGARRGWTERSALYAANMRHAGMLRIDHAMGLAALDPDGRGRKPGRGRPPGDRRRPRRLHRAREPPREVHGGRRGPRHGPRGVPQPADAGQHPGHAGAVERKGAEVLPPAAYSACVATHDLATLAGWAEGPTSPSASVGLLTLSAAGEAIATRRERSAGSSRRSPRPASSSPPVEDAPLHYDATAAAVHALIGRSGSILARAQFDDLVGETVRDQPARHRPRAAELADQAQPRGRGRLRRPPGARDPRGAGQGAGLDGRPRADAGIISRSFLVLDEPLP